jgi:elongation factor P
VRPANQLRRDRLISFTNRCPHFSFKPCSLQRSFFFTNSVTLEEIKVGSKIVGDKKKWIVEGTDVRLILFKGKVIEVVLSYPAVYAIVETEPNVEGSTGEDYTKPAVLDCGVTINVPGFLEQGQEIGVDTETGEYLGYYADETAL